MNLDEIRELIDLMRKNQIGEIDLESEGRRIRIKTQASAAPAPAVSAPVAPAPSVEPAPAAGGPPAEAVAPEKKGVIIKSPIVGTFYHASSPDKGPFVQVGDKITPNTVVCIIEAMKVMNEIKAEVKGTVLEILVENGQPLEFGQPLFVIDPE